MHLFELLPELLKLSLEVLHFPFEFSDPIQFHLGSGFGLRERNLSGKQMRVPNFFLTCLSGESGYERKSGGHERLKRSLDLFEARKIVKTAGPRADLTDGLRTPKHQDTQHSHLLTPEVHGFVHNMTILVHARLSTRNQVDQLLLSQTIRSLSDGILIEMYNWIPVRRLIARGNERI
jgi:hypothetical protein